MYNLAAKRFSKIWKNVTYVLFFGVCIYYIDFCVSKLFLFVIGLNLEMYLRKIKMLILNVLLNIFVSKCETFTKIITCI